VSPLLCSNDVFPLLIQGNRFGDYDAHFGMQTVNRTTQTRRYKKSFFDIVDFVNSRKAPTSK
jgi:hypothetical protein